MTKSWKRAANRQRWWLANDLPTFVILGRSRSEATCADPRIHSGTVRPIADGPGTRYRLGMTGYVYMTASKRCGTIYIGVTNDLARRIPEHKEGTGSRLARRYGVTRL